MSRTDPLITPGPGGRADIETKKAELCTSLEALHLPFSHSEGSPVIKDASSVEYLQNNFNLWSRELALCREEGATFKCSFRPSQSIEKDSVTVTRKGRILLAHGKMLSVILPDELVSIQRGVSSTRWGGFPSRRSTKANGWSASASFELHWTRNRPQVLMEQVKTLVLLEAADGREFDSVIRIVLSRRSQCEWRQALALASRCAERNTPFDMNATSHRAALVKLWRFCYPETRPPKAPLLEWEGLNTASEEWHQAWKNIGFEVSPEIAFEGTGILGLKHLLFFAEHHRDRCHTVLGKIPGSSPIPFATLSIAITKILLALRFDSGAIQSPLPVEQVSVPQRSPLARLLVQCEDPSALERLHALAMMLALKIFRTKHGNDRHRIGDVVRHVEFVFDGCLSNLPVSLEEVTVMLDLD